MRRPLIALLLLAGCAGPQPRSSLPDAGAGADRCAAFYAAVDTAVAEAGVRDGQAARVPGFPYLRVDRFLASFRHEVTDPTAFTAWVDRLRRLDRVARGFELANLPAARRDALARRWGGLHRRLERVLLWPMGVPAPGAMRQWGHHAIAFIGRRHLDDPYLLGRLFEMGRDGE